VHVFGQEETVKAWASEVTVDVVHEYLCAVMSFAASESVPAEKPASTVRPREPPFSSDFARE